MAVKGAEAKQKITQKILETFPNSFIYDKEIRIPVEENGEIIQIKITLTAAKVAVSPDGMEAVPAATPASDGVLDFSTHAERIEPTDEEKHNIASLLQSLGL